MPKSSRNKYSALDSSLNDDDKMNEGDNDVDNIEEIELNSLNKASNNNTTEKVHHNPPIISPSTPSTSLPSESSSPKPYGLTTRQR